jgi:quinol monooxygenase YgiN
MATDSEVAWLFELNLKPGHKDEFEALIPEMLEATRANEPGSRAYQFFTGDGSAVCVYERYVDSDAALAHMATFGEKVAARFMDAVSPVRFTVLGAPSAQLMEALAPIGAVVHRPVDGYHR